MVSLKNKSFGKKVFAIFCNEHFEDLVQEEIQYICGLDSSSDAGLVFFEGHLDDVVKYTYLTQSAKKVLMLLSKFKFEDDNDLLSKIRSLDFSMIDGSFVVRCNKRSLEKPIGSEIHRQLENPKVDVSSPDYPIYIDICGNKALVGIELSSLDLSKRTYKIFSHPSSIKGTLGYYLMKISGYDGKGTFLDPCAGSGTICIEAGYFTTKFSPRFFDKSNLFSSKVFEEIDKEQILCKIDDAFASKKNQANLKKIDIRAYDIDLQAVNATKKNLKIGGIEKFVSVAKGDIDWLETKFEENSVDYIVSNPPAYTKTNTKKADKFFDKFFYQTEYILSKKGKIVLLLNSERPLDLAKKYKLTATLERKFELGDSMRYIYSFKKV